MIIAIYYRLLQDEIMPEEIINNSTGINITQQTDNIGSTQSSSDNLPLRNAKLNLKITIIIWIILAITILSSATYLLSLPRKNESSNSVSTIIPTTILTPTTNLEAILKPPELYPRLDWKEVDSSQALSYLNNNRGKSWFSIDFDDIEVPTPGKQWHYDSDTVNSFEELSAMRSGFYKYYTLEFSKLGGWNNTVENNGKRIQAIVASGANGDMIGNIKIANDKMRLIVLQDNSDVFVRPTNECPCKISFDVFVSDIFSTAELEN